MGIKDILGDKIQVVEKIETLGFLQSIRYHSVVRQGCCLTRLFYRSLSLSQERSATNKHKQGCY